MEIEATCNDCFRIFPNREHLDRHTKSDKYPNKVYCCTCKTWMSDTESNRKTHRRREKHHRLRELFLGQNTPVGTEEYIPESVEDNSNKSDVIVEDCIDSEPENDDEYSDTDGFDVQEDCSSEEFEDILEDVLPSPNSEQAFSYETTTCNPPTNLLGFVKDVLPDIDDHCNYAQLLELLIQTPPNPSKVPQATSRKKKPPTLTKSMRDNIEMVE